jgi:hypothetical protein
MKKMNTVNYRNERKAVISALKKILKPHLWQSGYRKGPIGKSTPVHLWVQQKGESQNKSFSLRGGFLIKSFEGFTAEGVVTEAGCGLATCDYRELPIEDLFRLKNWATRKFASVVPPAK